MRRNLESINEEEKGKFSGLNFRNLEVAKGKAQLRGFFFEVFKLRALIEHTRKDQILGVFCIEIDAFTNGNQAEIQILETFSERTIFNGVQ